MSSEWTAQDTADYNDGSQKLDALLARHLNVFRQDVKRTDEKQAASNLGAFVLVDGWPVMAVGLFVAAVRRIVHMEQGVDIHGD